MFGVETALCAMALEIRLAGKKTFVAVPAETVLIPTTSPERFAIILPKVFPTLVMSV